MTLYMVARGMYSDYTVCGVYSTPEKAKEAYDFYMADGDVEELELDGMPDHPPGTLGWAVEMKENGTVYRIRREEPDEVVRWAKLSDGWIPHARLPSDHPEIERVSFYLWAKDEKHAVKIASEKRAQLIALNLWTTNYETYMARQQTEKA